MRSCPKGVKNSSKAVVMFLAERRVSEVQPGLHAGRTLSLITWQWYLLMMCYSRPFGRKIYAYHDITCTVIQGTAACFKLSKALSLSHTMSARQYLSSRLPAC